MRALVTGATGLVGRLTCRTLLGAGHEVRATVRGRQGRLGDLDVETVRADVTDPRSLVTAMAGVDLVIHCAAVYDYETDAATLDQVNMAGTRNVVRSAAEAGVPRVVVTSSSITCGSSESPAVRDESDIMGDDYVPAYFTSKANQERAAIEVGEQAGVDVVIACPGVVLGGPSARLVPSNAIILRYLLDPTRSTYPGGCDIVGATDVAAGLVLLAEHGVPGERYLLGGENLSWRTLHSTIADLTGVGGPYAELSTTAAYLASWFSEGAARLFGGTALSTREEALTIGRYFWYSHAKAAAIGYRPGTARTAIASSIAWLLADSRIPGWVRAGLTLAPEVRAARPLVPRPL